MFETIDIFGSNGYITLDLTNRNSINYALLKTFELLINPTSGIDPTNSFYRIFRGTAQSSYFTIMSDKGWKPIWEKSLGKINLDYPTISSYFGKDFNLIQPALFWTDSNLRNQGQPLSVSELLTSQFKEKIDHLYDNSKF